MHCGTISASLISCQYLRQVICSLWSKYTLKEEEDPPTATFPLLLHLIFDFRRQKPTHVGPFVSVKFQMLLFIFHFFFRKRSGEPNKIDHLDSYLLGDCTRRSFMGIISETSSRFLVILFRTCKVSKMSFTSLELIFL